MCIMRVLVLIVLLVPALFVVGCSDESAATTGGRIASCRSANEGEWTGIGMPPASRA